MKEKSPLGLLAGLGLILLGIGAMTRKQKHPPPQPAPSTAVVHVPRGRHTQPLVDLGDVSQLDVEGGWPDGLEVEINDVDRTVTHARCGGSWAMKSFNTVLVTYADEPHHTFWASRCWGQECNGLWRVIAPFEEDLDELLKAGYSIVVAGDRASAQTTEVVASFYAVPRDPSDATPVQREIHARGLAATHADAVAAGFEKLLSQDGTVD